MANAARLQRILGGPTTWLIGIGVAIGSGIFRTPGDVASEIASPPVIIGLWLAGGAVALMQGLVSAELATRFPKAGGEYVFLRQAYGRFVAFFFGWAYTIFIIGGGVATIAAALGDFTSELFGLARADWSGPLAALAVISVILINVCGLRAGAGAQNTLTLLKMTALLVIVAVGLTQGREPLVAETIRAPSAHAAWPAMMLAAMLPILWSYDGMTDAVKLAEEIKDVRRALPRALIGSTLALTALYTAVNVALLRVIPSDEMAGLTMAPGQALARLFGESGRQTMLVVAIVVCLGAMSSTVMATIRVTFALARDGLTFRFMGRMSARQSPIGALVVVGVFATGLVLWRDFRSILGIYFFASAILFGLSYLSLILFRARESVFPPNVFRCPFGGWLAGLLVALHVALAVNIAIENPNDIFRVGVLIVVLAMLYFVWKNFNDAQPAHSERGDRSETRP